MAYWLTGAVVCLLAVPRSTDDIPTNDALFLTEVAIETGHT